MHTSTHMLVAAALFARPGRENRMRNAAAILGGLAPDSIMFVMLGWSKIAGVPEYRVWSQWYFNPPWQTWIDCFHSIPVYLLLLAIGGLAWRDVGRRRYGAALGVFALAALSHIALDLPVHHDDAHAHFAPLASWRFRSPISYWDPAHYGNVVAPLETLGGIALCVFLWMRFANRWTRAALALAALSYAAPALYFG